MMSGRIWAHARSNVVAYVALFFAVSGGTAAALQGSNTVFSDDIVNGQVGTADVANDNTTRALRGADVAANSLGGADVNESLLGTVPQAGNADTLDGMNSSDFQASGAAAGGDLAGTYPNPTIANNALGSVETGTANDEIVDGTVDAQDLSVATADTASIDPPSVAANSCFTGDQAVSGTQIGDHVVITTPQSLDGGLSATALIPNANNEVRVRFCNVTNSAIDEGPETFNVIVIR